MQRPAALSTSFSLPTCTNYWVSAKRSLTTLRRQEWVVGNASIWCTDGPISLLESAVLTPSESLRVSVFRRWRDHVESGRGSSGHCNDSAGVWKRLPYLAACQKMSALGNVRLISAKPRLLPGTSVRPP